MDDSFPRRAFLVVNVIWLFMFISGIVVAALKGDIGIITVATLKGAEHGIAVWIGLLAFLIFWMGMLRIAEQSGLLLEMSKLLAPIIRFLFPDVPKDHPAVGYIISNMSANILGLANAATPMGLKAMQELQKLNLDLDQPTPAMCTLLAINTSSLTIIPTQIIALRMMHGSQNPTEIIGTCLFATTISTLVAVILDRWYRYRTTKLARR